MSTLTDLTHLPVTPCEVIRRNPSARLFSLVGRGISNVAKKLFSLMGGFFRAIGEAYWDACDDNRYARHSPYNYGNVRGIY